MEIFLKILGWQVANDDKKSMTFAEQFVALGVVFDISDMKHTGAWISNTQKRKLQVLHELDVIVKSKVISQKTAEVLVGKLQFMESHCFGKLGRSYLRCLRKFVHSFAPVNDEDVQQMQLLIDWLEKSEPRRVSPKHSSFPILFTDGACEYTGAERTVTCGAILFPSDGSSPECFGFEVPKHISESWALDADKDQLVTEAELLPVLIAFRYWRTHFEYSKSLVFVDSEPAKHCLIRGTSNVCTCAHIVKLFYQEIDMLRNFPWFSRVPSKSNPADDPSRLQFSSSIEEFHAKVVNPDVEL
jgi:hypothetical protein